LLNWKVTSSSYRCIRTLRGQVDDFRFLAWRLTLQSVFQTKATAMSFECTSDHLAKDRFHGDGGVDFKSE